MGKAVYIRKSPLEPVQCFVKELSPCKLLAQVERENEKKMERRKHLNSTVGGNAMTKFCIIECELFFVFLPYSTFFSDFSFYKTVIYQEQVTVTPHESFQVVKFRVRQGRERERKRCLDLILLSRATEPHCSSL